MVKEKSVVLVQSTDDVVMANCRSLSATDKWEMKDQKNIKII